MKSLDIDISDVIGDTALEIAAPRPDSPDSSEHAAIAACLGESGVPEHLIEQVAERLQPVVDEIVIVRAAETLRHLLRSLPGTSGEALQRLILGNDGESLATAAERVGVTKAAMWKAEQKLRRGVRPGPIVEAKPH
jgi:hypothetical protein